MKTDGYAKGLWYEWRAAAWLKKRGCRVAARRYRADGGEIDLVCLEGETLVFVEVKGRSQGRLGTGIAAVDAQKQRRVQHAAEAYLRHHQLQSAPYRFDIVEITRAGIVHVKNAF